MPRSAHRGWAGSGRYGTEGQRLTSIKENPHWTDIWLLSVVNVCEIRKLQEPYCIRQYFFPAKFGRINCQTSRTREMKRVGQNEL